MTHITAGTETRRFGTRTLLVLLALFVAFVLAGIWGWQHRSGGVTAPPYAYMPSDTEVSKEALELAQSLATGATAEVVEWRAPDQDRSLALAEAAVLSDGQKILVSWKPALAGAMLRSEVRADEDLRLIEALREYLPRGSTILAMPDSSQRIARFVEAVFSLATEPAPLLLPAVWQTRAAAVAEVESAAWAGPVSVGNGEITSGFLDALLAEDVFGAARLRVLAGDGDAYVLVHLRDAFAMGILRPDRFAMAERSFVASEFSHDLAREAKTWGREEGHAAYAIDRDPSGRLRGHFLTEARETATLLAQLLPFNTTRLGEVPGMKMVWQGGGYWLYHIAPLAVGENASE